MAYSYKQIQEINTTQEAQKAYIEIYHTMLKNQVTKQGNMKILLSLLENNSKHKQIQHQEVIKSEIKQKEQKFKSGLLENLKSCYLLTTINEKCQSLVVNPSELINFDEAYLKITGEILES